MEYYINWESVLNFFLFFGFYLLYKNGEFYFRFEGKLVKYISNEL